jgi:hypothetical protein
MEWKFRILYDKRYITLIGKLISSDKRTETVKVSGRNRSITIQSNRPFLQSKGLKHRKVNWTLIEGVMENRHLFEVICDNVEDYLRVHV